MQHVNRIKVFFKIWSQLGPSIWCFVWKLGFICGFWARPKRYLIFEGETGTGRRGPGAGRARADIETRLAKRLPNLRGVRAGAGRRGKIRNPKL